MFIHKYELAYEPNNKYQEIITYCEILQSNKLNPL